MPNSPKPELDADMMKYQGRLVPMADMVSAGWLRSIGFQIPDNIPDCAVVPGSAVHFHPSKVQVESGNDGAIYAGIPANISEPFQWQEMTFTIEPTTFNPEKP